MKTNYHPVGIARAAIRFNDTFVLVVLTAIVMMLSIVAGQLVLFGTLVAFLWFAMFSYVQPVPAVLLTLLLATNVLKFVDLSNLPSLRLAPGARFNAQDVMVLMVFVLGSLRLHQRQEKPLFLSPLQLFGAMAAISYILGIVAGTTDFAAGLNGLRAVSAYLFYIGAVGLIDSDRKLRAVVWSVFALVVISVVIQLVEVSFGQRLTTSTSVINQYFSSTTKTVEVGGLEAPYLWNRAIGYLLVGLFLALGGALRTGSVRLALLGTLAFLGFVVALMREWYVFIAVGLLMILILPRKGRLRAFMIFVLIVLVFAGFLQVLTSTGLFSAYPLLDVWVGRLGTLTGFQQESNYIVRVQTVNVQLNLFRQSPLFGYGPGSLDRLQRLGTFDFTDTGLPNTLVQYGLLGAASIALLITTFFQHGLRLYRAHILPREQGYVAGLLGAWVALVAAYSFGYDFFTGSEWTFAIVLVMVLLDRMSKLRSRMEQSQL